VVWIYEVVLVCPAGVHRASATSLESRWRGGALRKTVARERGCGLEEARERI
jgi:hypothetical protein